MVPTRRQEITGLLREREMGFEELRLWLEVPVKLLAEDLRHVERSLRSGRERLRMSAARCAECGFVFRERQRPAPPGRCPRCRSQRIEEPRFRVE